jgi:ubiquinol-cytochrome c reductase cytochrome c subunit
MVGLGAGAAVTAVLVAACIGPRSPSPAPYDVPAVRQIGATTDGRVLYERDCAWCHGAQGQGTRYGPNLNGQLDGGAYTDFMLSTGRMPLSSPAERAVRRSPRYTPAQIEALVATVESFGGTGPAVPAPNPAAGDLGAGESIYQANCAACHAMTGIGGALASGEVAPPLNRATPTQVAEAVLIGPGCGNREPACGIGSGAMPRFRFTSAELDDLTRYVEYLQARDNAGGWATGGIGPVAEGAVGLLIGLGALLLITRWTGTSADDEER